LAARDTHARAELMRHMLTTARRFKHLPQAQAVSAVVAEWLDAWRLERGQWQQVEREMHALTEAFHMFAGAPTPAHDAALRDSSAALDAALAREGTSIADQMVWRSKCAHGWWELVKPVPEDLAGRKERPEVPARVVGRPFWETGCAAFCRGDVS
jgi:hypothetical protein